MTACAILARREGSFTSATPAANDVPAYNSSTFSIVAGNSHNGNFILLAKEMHNSLDFPFVPLFFPSRNSEFFDFSKLQLLSLNSKFPIAAGFARLQELHAMCVDEVRHINGVINFESAVEFQNE